MSKEIRRLHHTLIDLLGMMNRPQRDTALIREAGIALDRALFPLLVALDVARQRIASILLADWSKKDLQHLARLMRRFVDDLLAWPD
jgi:hypothetical protein